MCAYKIYQMRAKSAKSKNSVDQHVAKSHPDEVTSDIVFVIDTYHENEYFELKNLTLAASFFFFFVSTG